MKTQDLSKLYKQLTPVEAGTMTFNVMFNPDRTEFEAIALSVAKVEYQPMYDLTCRHRYNKLVTMSLFYGMVYYRELSNSLAVYGHEKEQSHCPMLSACVENISSMQTAMIEVCKTLKVDIKTVNKMASIEEELYFNEPAKPDLVNYWHDVFMSGFE